MFRRRVIHFPVLSSGSPDVASNFSIAGRWPLDQNKLKKGPAEKGAQKRKQHSEELKRGPAGELQRTTTNATTTPAQTGEPHVGPPTDHYSGQLANSGHTGSTPTMKQDSGERDIREPEKPAREEEIREPNPDEREAAAESRRESRHEAAIEENPPYDNGAKDAA